VNPPCNGASEGIPVVTGRCAGLGDRTLAGFRRLLIILCCVVPENSMLALEAFGFGARDDDA
jgi:hypothetical protein